MKIHSLRTTRIPALALLLGALTAWLGSAQAQNFNFDTPPLPFPGVGAAVPFSYTVGGVTATFTETFQSPTGHGPFSIQNDNTVGITGFTLTPPFSGNFLFDSALNGSLHTLIISFSQELTGITFDFATIDVAGDTTTLQLTAMQNGSPVGTTNAISAASGVYWPTGTLSYNAGPGQQFNSVQIVAILDPAIQTTDFVLDNITVQTVPVPTYTIATSALPAAGGSTSGGGTVNSGASVTVVATANTGYAFVNWTESGTPVSTLASYSFTASANRTLVANFVQGWTIAASANPTAGGVVTGANTYTNNASVTLTASPNGGYAFVNWTEGGASVGTATNLTFTATTNRTLVANFVQTWSIAASANPTAGGTITGAGAYNDGASVSLTASPNTGYAFVNWTEGGTSVGTATNLTFTATTNRTLVANFVQTWSIAATANPTGGGTITGAGAYNDGASVSLTAFPNAGYAFVNWTEGGTSAGTATNLTFTATTNRTLVANFVQTWGIAASANPTGGGTITGAGTYNDGASVSLTAFPNAGYAFVNWTEGGTSVGTATNLTFTATTNRALVANFVLAQAPSLTISLTTTNTLLVSWPWPSTGYKLQQNVAVGTTNWTDATNTVDVVVDRNQVIVAPLTGQGFFRLFHP